MLKLSGGKWRGRRLAVKSSSIRPTAIRAREGLFNVLSHELGSFEGLRVADLFAGTGALGLEALSRGAAFCQFVENDQIAERQLRDVLRQLNAGKTADVLQHSATDLKSVKRAYDLIFLDPPYDKGLVEPCLRALIQAGWLHSATRLVVETDAGSKLVLPAGLICDKKRNWGRNHFLFLRAASG